MDTVLLSALLVMWVGSTFALVIFLAMWFMNEGEAFHPHSVDAERRHEAYVVVSSRTQCKKDCAVKSISSFVAPRGSSSSKIFSTICTTISISGMLGSIRWYLVGDASIVQFWLAFAGFGALILVGSFELDVDAERFLEDKQMITGWLIEKLKLDHLLPFSLSGTSEDFRNFLRCSPEIYYLFEEDRYLRTRETHKSLNLFSYEIMWESAHMIGACTYVILIPVAIILNDLAEEKVGWITGLSFFIFCMSGFFSGNYVPLFRAFRGVLLTWNPFVREPYFMLKLKRSVINYVIERDGKIVPPPARNEMEKAEEGDGKNIYENIVGGISKRFRTFSSTSAEISSSSSNITTNSVASPLMSKSQKNRRKRKKKKAASFDIADLSHITAATSSSSSSSSSSSAVAATTLNGHQIPRIAAVTAEETFHASYTLNEEGEGDDNDDADEIQENEEDRTKDQNGSSSSSATSTSRYSTRSPPLLPSAVQHSRMKSSDSMDNPRLNSSTSINYSRTGAASMTKSDSMSSTEAWENHQLKRTKSNVIFHPINRVEAAEADRMLNSALLMHARYYPRSYLRIVGYVMVMSELIAMLTPCVAMGIQWITALCEGPPSLVILDLLWEAFLCLRSGGIGTECQFDHLEGTTHCILKSHH